MLGRISRCDMPYQVFVSMDIGTTVNLANDLIKNRIQRPESGMNGKAGGPVILEPGTRAEWDKVLPVDRRDDVYFQVFQTQIGSLYLMHFHYQTAHPGQACKLSSLMIR